MWGRRYSCCHQRPAAIPAFYSRLFAQANLRCCRKWLWTNILETIWRYNSQDKCLSFPYVFVSSQGRVICVVSQQIRGNTFVFNSSWPTLWGTWPPIPPGPRGNIQTHRLKSRLRLPRPRRAAGRPILNMWNGKSEQRCWQLWCVLRGTGWCYHSQSYARMVRWKPLPGTAVGPQPPSAQAKHTLNVQTHTCTPRHRSSRSCPQDLLITLSERGGRQTQGGPTT